MTSSALGSKREPRERGGCFLPTLMPDRAVVAYEFDKAAERFIGFLFGDPHHVLAKK